MDSSSCVSLAPVPAVDTQGPPHASATPPPATSKWRDLFSTDRSIDKSLKLSHFSALHNTTNCTLVEDDLGCNNNIWKLCVVGYVAGKFPGYKILNGIIVNVWKTSGSEIHA